MLQATTHTVDGKYEFTILINFLLLAPNKHHEFDMETFPPVHCCFSVPIKLLLRAIGETSLIVTSLCYILISCCHDR